MQLYIRLLIFLKVDSLCSCLRSYIFYYVVPSLILLDMVSGFCFCFCPVFFFFFSQVQLTVAYGYHGGFSVRLLCIAHVLPSVYFVVLS